MGRIQGFIHWLVIREGIGDDFTAWLAKNCSETSFLWANQIKDKMSLITVAGFGNGNGRIVTENRRLV